MANNEYWLDFWESHREDLYEMYVNKRMTASEIAKTFNVGASSVYKALHRFSIPIRHDRYNAKYPVDMHYFDIIDTAEKAYILGFIVADGHVSKMGA